MRTLAAIRDAGSEDRRNIVLAPLRTRRRGAADRRFAALRTGRRVSPLARWSTRRPAAIRSSRFSSSSALVEEGLLSFDQERRHGVWDLNRIRAKGYTDNVVDLMVGKLRPLPARDAEGSPATCLPGEQRRVRNCCAWSTDNREEEMHEQLWEAVRLGLILRSESSYRFLHDRVQEAAYSLIPEELRARDAFAHWQRFSRRAPRKSGWKKRSSTSSINSTVAHVSSLMSVSVSEQLA